MSYILGETEAKSCICFKNSWIVLKLGALDHDVLFRTVLFSPDPNYSGLFALVTQTTSTQLIYVKHSIVAESFLCMVVPLALCPITHEYKLSCQLLQKFEYNYIVLVQCYFCVTIILYC